MPSQIIQHNTQNIPKFRFLGFEGDWKEKSLGDFANFFSGGTPTSLKTKYYKGEIPFIKSGEISKTKTEQFITKEALEQSSAKLVNEGDLLYALYGATSGEVAISKISGAINQAVLCIRTEQSKVWLLNYFKHNKNGIISKFLQGGQGNLSADIVKKLKIKIPEIGEQQKIAGFLGSLDEWIANLKSQKESLESYKKGMMQKIFSQEIRFKDDKGKSFSEWVEKKLSDVVDFSTAPYFEVDNNCKNGFYLVDMGAVSLSGQLLIRKQTNNKNSLLNKGDLVMPNRDIGHGDIIGKVALIDSDNKYVLGSNMYKLLVKKDLPIFIFYLINSKKVNHEMKRRSNGTSQLQLIRRDVESVVINIPFLSEQQKISNFLTSVDKIIESKKQQIIKTEQWKKGLMQGLFV